MKRLLSMLLVVMMVMSLAATAVYAEEETEVTLPFTDVKDGKWFTDAVKYVYANGLMNGKEPTKFAPNEVLTRAQFAKMLWSLAGEPATEANLDFADTKNTQWYAESLTWAVNSGIVNGYEEGGKKLFKPNKNIARDELAKMIVTFLAFMEVEIVGEDIADPFPDKIQNWAKEFVEAVRLSGLMKGKDGGAFAPKANATRAEGATIIMRMHPSLALTPTKIMEEMVENFLGEYQCATHQDIFIVNNFGGSHTNEAIAAAVATTMGLDSAVYTIAVTEGEVPNGGCGRQGYDYGDLVFTITDIASGETAEMATGVVCYKYYNIGANDEDGTVRYYHADPIYVLPVGCPEDISSITTPKIAEAALANLPTEYAVDGFNDEAIWNAVNAALTFENEVDAKSFELVLQKAEIDAIIASAEGATASGELTVALDRIGKENCGASVKINVTLQHKAVSNMEAMADAFIDTYMCVTHSDVLFTNNFGSSIVVENYVPAIIKAMNLDTAVYDFEITNFPFVNPGVGRTDGEATDDNNPMICKITHKETGLSYTFEFGAVTLKYYNIGAEEDGYTRHFNAPVQVLPEACPEDISSLQSPKDAEAIFAAMSTEIAVEEFSSEAIWNAINAATGIGTDIWELAIETADIDAAIAGVADFQYTGEFTLRLERIGKRAVYGETTIELTLKHKTATEMQEYIDEFLSKYLCGAHGQLLFTFSNSSTLTQYELCTLLAQNMGNPAKYYVTLAAAAKNAGFSALKSAYEGAGNMSGASGTVSFLLWDYETRTSIPFDVNIVAGKSLETATWGHEETEPVQDGCGINKTPMFTPYCNDDISSLSSAKEADEILAQLDAYVVDGVITIGLENFADIGEKAGSMYYAIQSLLKYDNVMWDMTLQGPELLAMMNNNGEGDLTVGMYRAGAHPAYSKGSSKVYKFKFVQKSVEEIVDDFLDKALCGTHNTCEMCANFGSSWNQENVLAAFIDGMGINTATHTLEITSFTANYVDGGYGRHTSGGEELSFKLTEIATGATAEFDVNCYVTKYYGPTDDYDGWMSNAHYPVSISFACPDDQSSLKNVPECQRILNGLSSRTRTGTMKIEYAASDDVHASIMEAINGMLVMHNSRYYDVCYNIAEMDAALANGGTGNVTFRVINTVKGDAHMAEVTIPVKLAVK